MRVVAVASLLAVVVLASPASARLYGDATMSGHIGGGFMWPLADAGDRLYGGFNLILGGTYWPGPGPLGVMAEVSYQRNSINRDVLKALGVPGGHTIVIPFNLNAMFTPKRSGRVGYYLTGGGGVYVLNAKATAPGTGYCDPWFWGWCSGEQTLAEATRARPGLDGGVGFLYDTGNECEIYLETRYHYVFLQESRTFQFVPITVGLRF